MKTHGKMVLIKQDRIQWQAFYMVKSDDFSKWKIKPGFTPMAVSGVHFRKPKQPCLFREEHRNIHNNSLKRRKN